MNLVEITVSEHHLKLRPFLLSIPKEFDAGAGLCLHQGRNVIRLFAWEDCHYVVKRFRYAGLFRHLAVLCGKDKARRSYANAVALLECGLLTPNPVGYVVRKNMMGWSTDGYYICEFTSMPALKDGLDEFGIFNRPLLHAFARFVACLHQNGFVHNDLNNTNVRYFQAGENYCFSLIDLNRMRTFLPSCPVPVDMCFDDLARFCCMGKMFEYFVREYIKARGWDESLAHRAIYIKKQHDRSYVRRKSFLRKLKRLLSWRL
ncbi:MAG: lipopolysaccharide kinase InaA family protein [Bacteroidaceae bacterium]|nr:lipopolysaccharide kinase InaA family protein [Bacteroidaceae bacterium]